MIPTVISIIVVLLFVFLSIYNSKKRIKLNQAVIEENKKAKEELERTRTLLETAKSNLNSLITSQNEALNSLEGIQKDIVALQLSYHEVEKALLDKTTEYEEKAEEFNILLANKRKEKEVEDGIIQDLIKKQNVIHEAKLREKEIREKKDFYRLAVSEVYSSDIQVLREIQPRFSQKAIIDKLIWETYYKPAYDALMGRLNFSPSKKVCGIYRITNLITEEPYIGQSVDIRERWRQHIKASLEYSPTQSKLYQSMREYGLENFSFEVLEEVPRAQLNEREVYWISFYKTKEIGLNSNRGGS